MGSFSTHRAGACASLPARATQARIVLAWRQAAHVRHVRLASHLTPALCVSSQRGMPGQASDAEVQAWEPHDPRRLGPEEHQPLRGRPGQQRLQRDAAAGVRRVRRSGHRGHLHEGACFRLFSRWTRAHRAHAPGCPALPHARIPVPPPSEATVLSFCLPQGENYGFVRFRNRQHAEQAKEAMEGCVLGKRPIRVGWGEASTQRNCVHVQVMALPLPLASAPAPAPAPASAPASNPKLRPRAVRRALGGAARARRERP